MTVSPFDLAAALGLHRPLETDRMLAMVAEQRDSIAFLTRALAQAADRLVEKVAEQRKQRDDARLELCEVAHHSRHVHERTTVRQVALEYGWGYLIPEEPATAMHEDQEDCDACKGEGVLAKDIEAHETETGCEERHDIDDDGAHCHCGVTLPSCPGCSAYSLGRKRP